MQRYINSVADLSGHPVSGASVQVNTYPGGTAATIYSDNGVTPQTNPITTPADGGFAFYAENGLYELVISGNNIATQTITGINLFDQSESTAASGIGYSQGAPGSKTSGTVGAQLDELSASGATSSRPTPAFLGQPYFDTTLGQPVWCSSLSPVTWVNAAGVSV